MDAARLGRETRGGLDRFTASGASLASQHDRIVDQPLNLEDPLKQHLFQKFVGFRTTSLRIFFRKMWMILRDDDFLRHKYVICLQNHISESLCVCKWLRNGTEYNCHYHLNPLKKHDTDGHSESQRDMRDSICILRCRCDVVFVPKAGAYSLGAGAYSEIWFENS